MREERGPSVGLFLYHVGNYLESQYFIHPTFFVPAPTPCGNLLRFWRVTYLCARRFSGRFPSLALTTDTDTLHVPNRSPFLDTAYRLGGEEAMRTSVGLQPEVFALMRASGSAELWYVMPILCLSFSHACGGGALRPRDKVTFQQ